MFRTSFLRVVLIALMSAADGLGGGAVAAEIKVVSTNGIRAALVELATRFEQATGHKVLLDFEVTAVVTNRINAGEPFDVAVLGRAQMEELAAQGTIERQPNMTFGRTGMGLGVRKGGYKPDIGTADALRTAMLKAPSVAYAAEGGSGREFMALLDRLGIREQMQGKVKPVGSPTVRAVVRGDAEIVFTSVGLILAEPAAELVGPLPAEVQTYAHIAIGAGAKAKSPEAARALVRFVTDASALSVLNAYGVER